MLSSLQALRAKQPQMVYRPKPLPKVFFLCPSLRQRPCSWALGAFPKSSLHHIKLLLLIQKFGFEVFGCYLFPEYSGVGSVRLWHRSCRHGIAQLHPQRLRDSERWCCTGTKPGETIKPGKTRRNRCSLLQSGAIHYASYVWSGAAGDPLLSRISSRRQALLSCCSFLRSCHCKLAIRITSRYSL